MASWAVLLALSAFVFALFAVSFAASAFVFALSATFSAESAVSFACVSPSAKDSPLYVIVLFSQVILFLVQKLSYPFDIGIAYELIY